MIVSETEIGAVALIMYITNVVVFVHHFYQVLELLFKACQPKDIAHLRVPVEPVSIIKSDFVCLDEIQD